jgi:prepilin-type N-terminal cleavage/methylation domain-containing protein
VKKTTRRAKNPAGFSLIEVMIAMAMLLIALGGLLTMFSVAVGSNANQGDSATRVTEYAQDKMEQLLALSFADGTTNTTSAVIPPVGLGRGLGGNMAAGQTAGSTASGSLTSGYYDYIAGSGALLGTTAAGALYIRQWSISTSAPGSVTLKVITVTVRALKTLGPGSAPTTTLVSYKSKTT